MSKRKPDSRTLSRPVTMTVQFPVGAYGSAIHVLVTKIGRLVGLTEGTIKDLARAIVELVDAGGGQEGVLLRFTFSKANFLVAIRTEAIQEDEDSLKARFESCRAKRLIDEAHFLGEPGSREFVLSKSSP